MNTCATNATSYSPEELETLAAIRRLHGGKELAWLVLLWLDIAHRGAPADYAALRRAAADAMMDPADRELFRTVQGFWNKVDDATRAAMVSAVHRLWDDFRRSGERAHRRSRHPYNQGKSQRVRLDPTTVSARARRSAGGALMPSLEETRCILAECGEGVNWSDDEIQRFADRTSRHAAVILETFAHHRTAITREYCQRKAPND